MPEDTQEMPEGLASILRSIVEDKASSDTEHFVAHQIELLSRAAHNLLSHDNHPDVFQSVTGILKVIDFYTAGFKSPEAE